jgi:spermidine dehydrogenase
VADVDVKAIARRDFLNGIALSTAAAFVAPWKALGLDGPEGLEKVPGYYPPALTGMRGSHDGVYEAAHALRDGLFWEKAGAPKDEDDVYDLVVVGGGVSGLTAAYFFRQWTGPKTRILVLENHDDFGGHAKRNEFTHQGRLVIGYGGSYSIDSPAAYSRVAQGLVRALGVDVERWPKVCENTLYSGRGLREGVFFDRQTFGSDVLLPAPAPGEGGEAIEAAPPPADAWDVFLAKAPMPDAARRDLKRIHTEKVDYLPGLTSRQKKAKLARMSYADFLTGPAKCDKGVLPYFQARPHSLYGVGIDAVPAQDAWGLGFPGFDGMGLDATAGVGMNRDAIPYDGPEYFFHFPDGNASLARLLVRALVPACLPAGTPDALVNARCDYAKLDEAGATGRVRLNSTVVRVAHRGPAATAPEVEVTYLRGGALHRVRGKRVVLACWSTMVPYLCPELPEAQRDALAYGVKVPIVYTNVLLRNWRAFETLKLSRIYAPGCYHTALNLDLPVSVGAYTHARTPDEPILLHMVRTPCSPGQPARQQHRAGRLELLTTTFDTFEQRIKDELGRMLGPGGFDAARDIGGITVNRWPHGYAYQYNSLWDPFWLTGGTPPCVTARKRYGRISIANADVAAYSYLDAAIDQGHRAAREATA